MPSDRKQFNVRMSDETAARVDRVFPVVAKSVGVELSQAQFFALAVAALAEKHGVALGTAEPTAVTPAKKGPARGKK